MKLSKVMKSHGWTLYPTDKDYNKLKIYQKDDMFLGVQKIGNVFRVDIQQCMNLGGMMLPSQKVLNNQIVPLDSLENALNDLLPQLT